MDDGVNKDDNKVLKMGATSNPNAAKIATLQERKKAIEETLAKHNQELRQLCLQEAELTGIMPIEYPLEPGETPPTFRRRIGTSFQLSQNLINNLNNEEEISALEVEMQVLAKMAEAALGLANENNGNKTVRRTHMAEYQQHKQRYNVLEEKLIYLKTRVPKQVSPNISQPSKQRKKPRPFDQDDTSSVNHDLFGKPVFRQSLRSLQLPTYAQDGLEYKYPGQGHSRLGYRGSDSKSLNENMQQYTCQDETLIPTFYRLSINGYKEYVDRQESPDHLQSQYIHMQSNNNLYKPHPPQYINAVHTLPHVSRRSPQQLQYTNQYQEYHKYNNNHPSSTNSLYRQTAVSSGCSSKYGVQSQYVYKPYTVEHVHRPVNPHQLQPHQQYEHDVMNSGLGGYWKRSESGETFWCNSSNESSAQRDKRFGSLDRRKNKRIQKRVSPNVDPKSATLAAVPHYHEVSRNVTSKAQQVVLRQRQDRQLVRTQSLGSVGAQIIDSICPSDDSSCGSETPSYNEHSNMIRKNKQREWYETSLDGPAPSTPSMSRSHSIIPPMDTDYPSPMISPQTSHKQLPPVSPPPPPPPQPPRVQTPKILEIPAESNPSPRIQEANLEIFNNNIPKNGTVVQLAQWKPYHEETKPFEMSDFYKYSTKFKRSPQKAPVEEPVQRPQSGFRNLPSPQGNANEGYDNDAASVVQKGVYQPLQPMKCQPYSPANGSMGSVGSPMNTSLDLSQLTSNVAENFSAEMNAWYQSHEHQTDNNNATLV